MLRIGIVGVTGAVGQEFLKIIEEKKISVSKLELFASERSVGKVYNLLGNETIVKGLKEGCFDGLDYVLFSAGTEQSQEWAPEAVRSGAVVIDNSSAFRMQSTVPLVIPEINLAAVSPNDKIIANPNCSTIMMLMGVAALRKFGRIQRLIVSTYQSSSGAGAAAMADLEEQTRVALSGGTPIAKILPHVYAFNVFSHDSAIGENGYNGEENKMILEARKILGDEELLVNPTCIRVPVMRAHSESITVEFDTLAPSVDDARQALGEFPGVTIVDDREGNLFPMPLDATGKDDVLVGRIRQDASNPRALSLFVSGDQIRKGAALNAIQIMLALEERQS